jgi:hypothetical protein
MGADTLRGDSKYPIGLCPFVNQFWIAARLVCSFCEAIAGSLSVASTAVSSQRLLWYCGEVGRSAVCSRYFTRVLMDGRIYP